MVAEFEDPHLLSPGFNYRGVHAEHPALAAAKSGVVLPGNPSGIVAPEDHNLGDFLAESPFTSWTKNRNHALRHARRRGPGGVLLSIPARAPNPEEKWSWEWSPDEFGEEEVLLRGEISGATVELV